MQATGMLVLAALLAPTAVGALASSTPQTTSRPTVVPHMTLPPLCGLLPRRPPGPPRHPPALVDPCTAMNCTAEPAPQCYEHAGCEQGKCAFSPSPLGTACDDGNSGSAFDVCSGRGRCGGLVFECPADIVVTPVDSDKANVEWVVPSPKYHNVPFMISSNYVPGDEFSAGTTTVTYDAQGFQPLANQLLMISCSFNVTIIDPCDTLVCGPAAADGNQCVQPDTGVCLAGRCVFEPLLDFTPCRGETGAAVCASGECIDPCATADLTCDPAPAPCYDDGRCRVNALFQPYCEEPQPKPLSEFPPPPEPDFEYSGSSGARPEHMALPSLGNIRCWQGSDICGPPKRWLPRLPPMPPRHPPALVDPCTHMECPEPPQCYAAAGCSQGKCLDPTPVGFGQTCDDGSLVTPGDVCNGKGRCSGVVFECPADMVITPVGSDKANVEWVAPSPKYHNVPFMISSNYVPGDEFSVGSTTVTYDAQGFQPITNQMLMVSCSFNVTIIDPCDTLVCGPAAAEGNQCVLPDTGVCLGGRCVFEPLPDLTPCEGETGAAVCGGGECLDPCALADLSCAPAPSTCYDDGRCRVNALLQPYCEEPQPKPFSEFPRPPAPEPEYSGSSGERPEHMALPSLGNIRCWQGSDICAPPMRLLPRRPLAPPRHPHNPWVPVTLPTVPILTQPPTTPDPGMVVCAGRLTVEDVPRDCNCLNNCHRCNMIADTLETTECLVCKNERYLYLGECVDTCPPTTEPRGGGSFYRQCDALPTTTQPPTTQPPSTMSPTSASPTSSAPPVYTCAGRSLAEDPNTDCLCSGGDMGDCHACSWSLGAPVSDSCSMCKNQVFFCFLFFLKKKEEEERKKKIMII